MVFSARDRYFVARPEGKTPGGFPPARTAFPNAVASRFRPAVAPGLTTISSAPTEAAPQQNAPHGSVHPHKPGCYMLQAHAPLDAPHVDGLIKIAQHQ